MSLERGMNEIYNEDSKVEWRQDFHGHSRLIFKNAYTAIEKSPFRAHAGA